MRKIRIGNDIRLKLTLRANEEAGFDKLNELDQSSVKQLRCYLINTSWNRPPDPDEPMPYKRVGFPEFYKPAHHNINNAGFPSYHMLPANVCNYDRFSPDFHDFHWWPGYRGFGLHPEHFHGDPWHFLRGPHVGPSHFPHPNPNFLGPNECDCPALNKHPFYKPEPGFRSCEEPYHPDFVPVDVFGKPAEDHSHQNPWAPWYLADSQVTHETNTVTCFFPAVQQRLCGTYKLVIVLTVFEQGWGRHNLRTYTIDKGDIFELVDDASGESGNIYVDVDDTGYKESEIESIYALRDAYTMASGTQLAVGGQDADGYDYNIYCVLKDGTTVLYNPQDWHFSELWFESSDENIVKVRQDGTLYAQDIDDMEKQATITVRDKYNDNAVFEYTVTVKLLDTLIMGFDPTVDINQMTSDKDTLNEYSCKAKTYVVHNPQDGYYLWIYSQRRIHYIKSVEDNNELAAELSSGFRVPMTNAEIKHGYYCYRSVSPILRDDMRIKIKFE